MSEMKTLSVQKRNAFGKGANRRLRVQNMVPGVYYTTEGENVAVQVAALPLSKLYAQVGRTNVFHLEIEDEAGQKVLHPVFVWDAQYHPVKSTFTHIDFYGVDLNKEIKVEVPVEFVGTSKGVKLGGTLETYREVVTLMAKPEAMPRKVQVDVSDMGINDSLRISQLSLPEGVRAVFKTDFPLVAVLVEADEDADAASAAAPAAS